MKSLSVLIILTVMFITGCSDPVPMGDGAAKAFQSCLDKGWKPRYFSNMGQVDFTCKPHGKAVAMNEFAATTMDACLSRHRNAIYDAKTGSVMCVEEGGDIQLSE